MLEILAECLVHNICMNECKAEELYLLVQVLAPLFRYEISYKWLNNENLQTLVHYKV